VTDFFARLDQFAGPSTLTVDRARGTAHPRIADVIYPLDYGHVDCTDDEVEQVRWFLADVLAIGGHLVPRQGIDS
jgi:hypothetical protein